MSKVEETAVPKQRTRNRHDEYGISHARVLLITTFVAFGDFLFGYDCIIGGQLVEIKKFAEDFGNEQINGEMGFSAAMRGAFVSTMTLGTFLGALSAPLLCDRFGRKMGTIYTCVIFSVGITCQTAASHLTF
jgi:MFS transporter, SP family, sugar:H+ symporter